jgi:hypothetical protein
MKKHIALVAMLISGSSAMGADTEFKWDAESRTRFFGNTNYTQNAAGLAGGSALNSVTDVRDTVFRQRTSLGLNFKKGDSLSGRVRLLHSARWGAVNGTDVVQPNASNANSLAYIQEGWLAWNFAENMTAKWGRMALMTVADGTVVSTNEWLQNPYAVDALALMGDYSFARIAFMGVKAADVSAPIATNADPETVFYGLSFDVKNLPDALKGVNLHAIQQSTDESASAGTSLTRYGLTVSGDMMGLDYRLTYAMAAGKTISAGTSTDIKSSMIDAGIGYSMADFRNARIGLIYHMDSGNDQDTANGSERYQGFFYERHKNAGRMDLIGWGNLTNIDVQATMDLTENSMIGLNYIMFSRSSDKDTASLETYSSAGTGTLGSLTATDATANTDKTIGSEIDVYLTHKYDNGLELTARYGMFSAGEYLKKSIRNDLKSVTQMMLEARATF